MPLNNDLANLHLLSKVDSFFFEHKVKEIKERMDRICEESKLDGDWTLSADFKFLVKVER